jgi:hypothetical protein
MRHSFGKSTLRPGILVMQLAVASLASAQNAPAPGPAPPSARAATAVPSGLPAFQPGLWEYRRTMMSGERGKPQTAIVKKCGDPSSDIQQKLADLKQKGCRFTPLARSGNLYQSSWICPATDGFVATRDALTVKSAVSYEDDNESHLGQRTVHSKIVATRLGECPVPGAAAATGSKR